MKKPVEKVMSKSLGANTAQVGGTHYKAHGREDLQHWDIVHIFALDYFVGNISKYLFRWREKGGLQDLLKARHYLDKYIELNGGEHTVDVALNYTPEQLKEIVQQYESRVCAVGESSFAADIEVFNDLYKLPRPSLPTAANVDAHYKGGLKQRLEDFRGILLEEVTEVDEIIIKLGNGMPATHIEILVELADWFGDIVVYVYSEARKFGLPMDKVLRAIMESNFSKLGADGKPLVNESGKVLKGPNYQPPEPMLRKMLVQEIIERLGEVKAPGQPTVFEADLGEAPPPSAQEPTHSLPTDYVDAATHSKVEALQRPGMDYVAKAAHDKVEAARYGMTIEGWWGDGTQLYKEQTGMPGRRRTVRARSAEDAAAQLGLTPLES